jgi:nicotinamide mononucleotide transporter
VTNRWELLANTVNLASIALATFNSWHTWWTGIVGCLLFGYVFMQAHLYADATLQVFFIGTSVYGAWHWMFGSQGEPVPVARSSRSEILTWTGFAICAALGYGWLLHRWTDAYSPFIDSLVLTFSVLAQLLLMKRRAESWWAWFVVNSIAVPLYVSRELYVTAAFYSAFWVNALVGLVHWHRLARASQERSHSQLAS